MKSSVHLSVLSIDDGLNKDPKHFPGLKQHGKLQTEKESKLESKLDRKNSSFMSSLKY